MLSGCALREQIPFPREEMQPRVTLPYLARPYPDRSYFSTTTTTDAPCDLDLYLCSRNESAFDS